MPTVFLPILSYLLVFQRGLYENKGRPSRAHFQQISAARGLHSVSTSSDPWRSSSLRTDESSDKVCMQGQMDSKGNLDCREKPLEGSSLRDELQIGRRLVC